MQVGTAAIPVTTKYPANSHDCLLPNANGASDKEDGAKYGDNSIPSEKITSDTDNLSEGKKYEKVRRS